LMDDCSSFALAERADAFLAGTKLLIT